MNSDLEADVRASGDADARDLVERQGLRIAELEEQLHELADLRGRLLETEQQLAELPDLRERSSRLAGLESSPLVRLLSSAGARASLSTDRSTRSIRIQVKRVLSIVARRIAGGSPER